MRPVTDGVYTLSADTALGHQYTPSAAPPQPAAVTPAVTHHYTQPPHHHHTPPAPAPPQPPPHHHAPPAPAPLQPPPHHHAAPAPAQTPPAHYAPPAPPQHHEPPAQAPPAPAQYAPPAPPQARPQHHAPPAQAPAPPQPPPHHHEPPAPTPPEIHAPPAPTAAPPQPPPHHHRQPPNRQERQQHVTPQTTRQEDSVSNEFGQNYYTPPPPNTEQSSADIDGNLSPHDTTLNNNMPQSPMFDADEGFNSGLPADIEQLVSMIDDSPIKEEEVGDDDGPDESAALKLTDKEILEAYSTKFLSKEQRKRRAALKHCIRQSNYIKRQMKKKGVA